MTPFLALWAAAALALLALAAPEAVWLIGACLGFVLVALIWVGWFLIVASLGAGMIAFLALAWLRDHAAAPLWRATIAVVWDARMAGRQSLRNGRRWARRQGWTISDAWAEWRRSPADKSRGW